VSDLSWLAVSLAWAPWAEPGVAEAAARLPLVAPRTRRPSPLAGCLAFTPGSVERFGGRECTTAIRCPWLRTIRERKPEEVEMMNKIDLLVAAALALKGR
jgi:hypothetical protein